MDVRQQLRGRAYASSEVHHEALVECVRSCGVREREPGHDLHRVRARRTAKRARQRKTRHSNPAGMDRCLAGTTRAGRSRSPAHRRHAERSDVMNPRGDNGTRSDANDARTHRTRGRRAAGTVSRHAARVEASREGAAFPAARTFGSVPAVRRGDFVRASAVDTTSVSSSDDDSELGELRV